MRSFFVASFTTCAAVAAASFTTDLTIKQCDAAGCKPVQKRIALDVTSNSTSSSGEKLINVGGAGMDELTLTYGGADVGGPRVYLIEEDGVNENYMFMLKNQEFAFDVELSTMPCGFNAALYFVGMTANEGGAENGTNYCDAQAVAGVFCSEMDIMEANTVAQQFTTHACVDACSSFSDAKECKGTGSPSKVCDQNGCGLNPFRYGPGTTYNTENTNAGWYGAGAGGSYALDSAQPYTVVTQFNAAGSSAGELGNITRFYIQKGNRVDLPTLFVLPPTDGSHMGGFAEVRGLNQPGLATARVLTGAALTGGFALHRTPTIDGLTAAMLLIPRKPAITQGYCTDIYDRWNPSDGWNPPRPPPPATPNPTPLQMPTDTPCPSAPPRQPRPPRAPFSAPRTDGQEHGERHGSGHECLVKNGTAFTCCSII
jgi:hypothetical protein